MAIVFNPLWGVADYYTAPAHWKTFLIIRLSVALITLLALIFRKGMNISSELLAFIPMLGISLQNAYMYNVMDIEAFQKHTFAYIALFIGGGMLVLWKPVWSYIFVVITLAANALMYNLFSPLHIDEYLTNGGLLTFSVAAFTILLIHTRYDLTRKEIIARLSLAESNLELEKKNEIIAEKNKDITDSINYAKGIQFAMLSEIEDLKRLCPDVFMFFKPKDIISGDFYWFANIKTTPQDGSSSRLLVVAVADCTGHGVPGAFMTFIGHSLLHHSVNIDHLNSPSDTLNYMNKELKGILRSVKDGMDIAMVAIDFDSMQMQFAGANNPVYIVRNHVLHEIKADKQPIGHYVAEAKPFTDKYYPVEKGDMIYLFSDGFPDQFGGETGGKYKSGRFKKLLESIDHLPCDQQNKIIENEFNTWKGNIEQVDDILVIGFRI